MSRAFASSAHPVEASILMRASTDLRLRLKAIRIMVFDVDGILTDGSLWLNEHGETMKRFHALDGHGMRLLNEQGIRVAWMSGRDSAITSRRAVELGIEAVMQGVRDKLKAMEELGKKAGLDWSSLGYMGDDLIDLQAMQKAGFAASVPNAPFYVREHAHWVASVPGGSGAVRECCDLLLAAQGRLADCFTIQLSGGATQ